MLDLTVCVYSGNDKRSLHFRNDIMECKWLVFIHFSYSLSLRCLWACFLLFFISQEGFYLFLHSWPLCCLVSQLLDLPTTLTDSKSRHTSRSMLSQKSACMHLLNYMITFKQNYRSSEKRKKLRRQRCSFNSSPHAYFILAGQLVLLCVSSGSKELRIHLRMELLMRGHSFQTAARLCWVLGCLNWCTQVSRKNWRGVEDTSVCKVVISVAKAPNCKRYEVNNKEFLFLFFLQQVVTQKATPLQTCVYIQCSENVPKSASKGNLMMTWKALKGWIKCQPDSKLFCFYIEVFIECN